MRRALNTNTHALKQHRLSLNSSLICSSFLLVIASDVHLSLRAKRLRNVDFHTAEDVFKQTTPPQKKKKKQKQQQQQTNKQTNKQNKTKTKKVIIITTRHASWRTGHQQSSSTPVCHWPFLDDAPAVVHVLHFRFQSSSPGCLRSTTLPLSLWVLWIANVLMELASFRSTYPIQRHRFLVMMVFISSVLPLVGGRLSMCKISLWES